MKKQIKTNFKKKSIWIKVFLQFECRKINVMVKNVDN